MIYSSLQEKQYYSSVQGSYVTNPRKEIPSFEEEMKSKMDELAKQLSDLKSTLEKTAAPGQQQA